jgi:hypothetical protein
VLGIFKDKPDIVLHVTGIHVQRLDDVLVSRFFQNLLENLAVVVFGMEAEKKSRIHVRIEDALVS